MVNGHDIENRKALVFVLYLEPELVSALMTGNVEQ